MSLNVKSTGHDFLGPSNDPGSLSIWVHSLNSIEYHEGEFKLDGCDIVIPGRALIVGGTDSYAAYLKAGEHDQAIVGDTAKSVGFIGHSCAGRHSIVTVWVPTRSSRCMELRQAKTFSASMRVSILIYFGRGEESVILNTLGYTWLVDINRAIWDRHSY